MKKILILESGKSISNMMGHLFADEGYMIISEKKLAGYLSIDRTGLRFLEDTPDLIVADLTSIKNVKVEMLMQLKNTPVTSFIPFLLITSKSGAMKEHSSAPDYYLSKPFSTKELFILVKRILSDIDSLSPW